MKLEREQFRISTTIGPSTIDRGADTNSPQGWNRIRTSGCLLSVESVEAVSHPNAGERLQELRFDIHQEENKEREREGEEKPPKPKTSGFEPFISDGEGKERTLFVNLYGGNFAQKMELNRKGVEKTLQIAHLGGQVFLASVSPNRHRSIEANPDGSVSGKGSLMLGEKIEEDEKDKSLYKVSPIPQGWRIEINDKKLTEELTDKKLSGKELQRAFIRKFNGVLRKGLFECVWREKLSGVKDKYYREKLFLSIVYNIFPFLSLIGSNSVLDFAVSIGLIPFACGLLNTINHALLRGNNSIRKVRNIDHPLEMFMPPVEVDKVARAFAYLRVKGRRLVKEVKEN